MSDVGSFRGRPSRPRTFQGAGEPGPGRSRAGEPGPLNGSRRGGDRMVESVRAGAVRLALDVAAQDSDVTVDADAR